MTTLLTFMTHFVSHIQSGVLQFFLTSWVFLDHGAQEDDPLQSFMWKGWRHVKVAWILQITSISVENHMDRNDHT